jgi:hypothetical protein
MTPRFNNANEFYDNALRTAITAAVINQKANACPFLIRLAWHASGTYDKVSWTAGSDGATMRYAPEIDDPANAGLSIAQDILLMHRLRTCEPRRVVSRWNAWVMGGPKVPF